MTKEKQNLINEFQASILVINAIEKHIKKLQDFNNNYFENFIKYASNNKFDAAVLGYDLVTTKAKKETTRNELISSAVDILIEKVNNLAKVVNNLNTDKNKTYLKDDKELSDMIRVANDICIKYSAIIINNLNKETSNGNIGAADEAKSIAKSIIMKHIENDSLNYTLKTIIKSDPTKEELSNTENLQNQIKTFQHKSAKLLNKFDKVNQDQIKYENSGEYYNTATTAKIEKTHLIQSLKNQLKEFSINYQNLYNALSDEYKDKYKPISSTSLNEQIKTVEKSLDNKAQSEILRKNFFVKIIDTIEIISKYILAIGSLGVVKPSYWKESEMQNFEKMKNNLIEDGKEISYNLEAMLSNVKDIDKLNKPNIRSR